MQTWSEIGSSLRELRKSGFTPKDLAALVARCNRVSNLPRSEVERLVHKVFVEIMSGSREAANLGL